MQTKHIHTEQHQTTTPITHPLFGQQPAQQQLMMANPQQQQFVTPQHQQQFMTPQQQHTQFNTGLPNAPPPMNQPVSLIKSNIFLLIYFYNI